MRIACELRVSKDDCVRKSRSTGLSADNLPRWASVGEVQALSVGAWRFLPYALALAVTLVSGSAIARGGGHGGGGHSGGGHRGVGRHDSAQSVVVYGGGHSTCGLQAGAGTPYVPQDGDTAVAHDGESSVAETAPAEPSRRLYEAPHPPPDANNAPLVAPRPPRPASPAGIYTYTDARGVIHFTSYRPADGAAQVY